MKRLVLFRKGKINKYLYAFIAFLLVGSLFAEIQTGATTQSHVGEGKQKDTYRNR